MRGREKVLEIGRRRKGVKEENRKERRWGDMDQERGGQKGGAEGGVVGERSGNRKE